MQASVKNLMPIILLVSCLSGCVGYYRSKSTELAEQELSKAVLVVPVNERRLWKRTEPRFVNNELAPFLLPEDQRKDPAGKEIKIYGDKTLWCGLTVWAIVPIPLWQPDCRTYTELTFEYGLPISAREQSLEGAGFLCGPFVPLLGISKSPFPESFCGPIK